MTSSHLQSRKTLQKMLIVASVHLILIHSHVSLTFACFFLVTHHISDYANLFIALKHSHGFSSMHEMFFLFLVWWVVYLHHLDFSLKSTSVEKTSLNTLSKVGLPLLVFSLTLYLLLTMLSLQYEKNNLHSIPMCLLLETGSFRQSPYNHSQALFLTHRAQ